MSELDGKDDRGAAAFNSKQKTHHGIAFHGASRPDVIVKTVTGNAKPSTEGDSFGANDPNVPYSLNKGKRWEKVDDAELHLESEEGTSKTFVETVVPRSVPYVQSVGVVDMEVIASHSKVAQKLKGGVTRLIEATLEGEIVQKTGKSSRTTVNSLQETSDPGPYSRREGRMLKEEEKMRKFRSDEQEGSGSSSEDNNSHVRYTAVRLTEPSAEMKESAWRKQQKSSHVAKASKKRSNINYGYSSVYVEEHIDEWQDAWEEALDQKYEAQLDSDKPLVHPKQQYHPECKSNTHDKKKCIESPKKEEFPLRDSLSQTTKRLVKLEQKKNEEFWRTRLFPREKMKELDTPEVFDSVLRIMGSRFQINYLPCLPTTMIFHEKYASSAVGQKVDHCIMIRDLGSRIVCYKAPSFCCSEQPVIYGKDGWAVQHKSSLQKIDHSITSPEASVLVQSVCAVCGRAVNEKTELEVEEQPFFGMPCGHLACEPCWIEHCIVQIREDRVPIRCLDAECTSTLTVTQFAALVGDQGVAEYIKLLWEKMAKEEGTVKCAACPSHFVRDEFDYSGNPLSPIVSCTCGMRTCVACQWREHRPLPCDTYFNYIHFLHVNFFQDVEVRDVSIKPDRPELFAFSQDFLSNVPTEGACTKCGKHTMLTCSRNHRCWCYTCGRGLFSPCDIPLELFPEELAKVMWTRASLSTEEWKNDLKSLKTESPPLRRLFGKLLDEAAHNLEMIALREQAKMQRSLSGNVTKSKRHLIKAEQDLSVAFNSTCKGNLPLQERIDILEKAIFDLRAIYDELA